MKSIKRGKVFLLILIVGFVFYNHSTFGQVYGWSPITSGINGNVYAIIQYNNKIIIAGSFSLAGGIAVNNIAQWDGTSWSPLGEGFDAPVYALVQWNGSIYAGGAFTHTGTNSVNHLASWDGVNWNQVGFTGVNGDVKALTVYNGLVVGGTFTRAGFDPVNNIARWNNGINWFPFVNGLDGTVECFSIYNNVLIVGGDFNNTLANALAVNHIASYDEHNWENLATGTDSSVYALTTYNGILYAGGKFSNPAPFIAKWNGSAWSSLGQPVDNSIYSLASYNGQLIAGGSFHFANNLYASRIAAWNGSSWARMITGMNNNVNALYVYDSLLYAGGNFTTAGGTYINHVSYWGPVPTHIISGHVYHSDNQQPVDTGLVIGLRVDVATREIIVVDSTYIYRGTGGAYSLIHVPIGDSIYIASFPDDEEEDNFVPTYHQSTIDWQSAIKVYPNMNLSNIDISVYRVSGSSGIYSISGYVYLNFLPQLLPSQGYSFWSGAIVYASQSGVYKGFGVTDINQHYVIPNLPAGTYTLFANRVGYTSQYKTVVIGNANQDSTNFNLDTINPIGIHKISSELPQSFNLYQNYPNPFNPVTIIRFDIQNSSDVKLSIFNILGQEVKVLINEKMQPGEYKVTFNASNMASGVYFYKLESGSYNETKKMVLIK